VRRVSAIDAIEVEEAEDRDLARHPLSTIGRGILQAQRTDDFGRVRSFPHPTWERRKTVEPQPLRSASSEKRP
jgi:hypothetical protein